MNFEIQSQITNDYILLTATGEISDLDEFKLLNELYFKEIRKNQIAYEHLDITLIKDNEVIFSSYMNNRKAKYAFYVNKEKYPIEEKEFLELMANLKSYFKIKAE